MLSLHVTDGHQMYFGGSVVGKASTTGRDLAYPLVLPSAISAELSCMLSLTVFTQRNFVADFLRAKCDFTRKIAVLRF